MISEFEVTPSVWNALTPEYRARVKKHCLEQKDVNTVLHCQYRLITEC